MRQTSCRTSSTSLAQGKLYRRKKALVNPTSRLGCMPPPAQSKPVQSQWVVTHSSATVSQRLKLAPCIYVLSAAQWTTRTVACAAPISFHLEYFCRISLQTQTSSRLRTACRWMHPQASRLLAIPQQSRQNAGDNSSNAIAIEQRKYTELCGMRYQSYSIQTNDSAQSICPCTQKSQTRLNS